MQLWYSSIDGSPGINKSALDTIREKAKSYQEHNHHPLHLALISDEMAIRKNICWNAERNEFIGFSTVTSSSIGDHEGENQSGTQLKVAKDALVFMIVGPDFKMPIGYHLLNGLEAIDRAALTLEAIRCVEEAGTIIMTLTGDGLNANVVVSQLLGANFDQGKHYFHSPTYPEKKIYIIFDPPHMLKLVRKHFSTANIYSENQLLDWDLLRILVEKQRTENFNLSNKLTQHHIDWHQKPMNVKLAAQTISASVADALEQLHDDGYEEFTNVNATVEFLRNFNDIFDILNFAEKNQANDRYKQPLCKETAEVIFSFTERMELYIKGLEIEVKTKKKGIIRKPIFKSREYMGFFGFYNDLISLKGIYNDFVQNGPLEILYTMQISQDHLETLFSLFRNRQGNNDNPNAVEFKSAFRKLLVCHPFTTSMDHNVISNATGILTVPSTTRPRLPPADSMNVQQIEINFEEAFKAEADEMDPYDKHTCAYVALCIEEKMIQNVKLSKKHSCYECLSALDQNEKIQDELLAKKEKVRKQPCKSTFEIVIFSNAVKKIISLHDDQETSFNAVGALICENLNTHVLCTAPTFEHGHNHKNLFLKQIVNTYQTLKSANIGMRITDEERGAFIRSRLKTQTHLAGQ